MLWENTTNEEVLQNARDAIWESWRRTCRDNAGDPRAKELFDRHKLPAFYDPFAGGGTLPLEAQRLGLEAYASDLNPVAVLICKAMIEIPPKFAGKPPVNPDARKGQLGTKPWKGAQGLAEDVRYYGQWMRDEAKKRIGQFYPQIEITAQMAKERPDFKPLVGKKLTAIVWLWARTVNSPNPAFRNVDVPLASTFVLSTRPGQEAYIEPVKTNGNYQFFVRSGKLKIAAAKVGTSAGKRSGFRCLMSDVPIGYDYIRAEGQAGRIGRRLMAIVVEGPRGHIYLGPTDAQEELARNARDSWKPDIKLPDNPRDFKTPNYGLTSYGNLFTRRQLLALNTFCDLVLEARNEIEGAARAAWFSDTKNHVSNKTAAKEYADSVAVYLSLGVGRSANYWSSFTPWGGSFIVQTFGRQALPMVWDYAEGNPFSDSTGNWTGALEWIEKVITNALPASVSSFAKQAPAQTQRLSVDKIVSTDPPYYDNIGYAELSDFFYVWLRRCLRSSIPDLFATVTVPKTEELVATPYRHGGREKADAFFLSGMTEAMQRLVEDAHPAFPVTIYYAFKQAETDGESGTASTGWETFLNAIIHAGFAVTGTWPIRTERDQGLKTGLSVLASSIIIVCRPHPADTRTTTRRDFVATLQRELPQALRHLQAGNIAPVDLAQAAIGPGMAIFTHYTKVLDAKDRALRVRDALTVINQVLDEALAEQEGDFDADTRWALAWFEQYGFGDGEFGVAETLSKAKNTSVSGIVEAGIARSKAGKVRLLKPNELPVDWDPTTDLRLTHWEIVHQLIRALEAGGEAAAAEIVAKLGSKAETARELCYRLYTLCERKKRAAEALSYNALVQSWPEVMRLAKEKAAAIPVQQELV